jgi:hypothetical protein
MSTPKKHHYVPEFYLKRWTGEDRKVSDYRRFAGKLVHRRRFPSETGFEIELYSIRSHTDPERRQIIEKRLMSRIDNSASLSLDYMEKSGQPPTDSEHRNAWTRFLLSLIYRSPSQVEKLRQKIAANSNVVLQSLASRYGELRRESDPETFDEYLAMDDGRIEEESLLPLMQKVIGSKLVGTALIRMTWGIIQFNLPKHGFLTCDIPIMLSNGLGHRDSFVMLPISPSRLFIAAARKPVIDSFSSQDAEVLERAINDAVVQQAQQVVISRDNGQRRFIDNRFLHSPPPEGDLALHTWKHPLVDL